MASAPAAAAAAAAPLQYECVRIRSSHNTSWHLWDVLPKQIENGGMASETVSKE